MPREDFDTWISLHAEILGCLDSQGNFRGLRKLMLPLSRTGTAVQFGPWTFHGSAPASAGGSPASDSAGGARERYVALRHVEGPTRRVCYLCRCAALGACSLCVDKCVFKVVCVTVRSISVCHNAMVPNNKATECYRSDALVRLVYALHDHVHASAVQGSG